MLNVMLALILLVSAKKVRSRLKNMLTAMSRLKPSQASLIGWFSLKRIRWVGTLMWTKRRQRYTKPILSFKVLVCQRVLTRSSLCIKSRIHYESSIYYRYLGYAYWLGPLFKRSNQRDEKARCRAGSCYSGRSA